MTEVHVVTKKAHAMLFLIVFVFIVVIQIRAVFGQPGSVISDLASSIMQLYRR